MFKIIFFINFLSVIVYATEQDSLSIDSLLKNIEKKTDLSEKTKLENSGISTIYTRDDLQRMQARKLKDVLKSIYFFGYAENRYGLPDPYHLGTTHPFLSSSIRVFIDNQEISSGLYGSGLIMYGDLDIGFVDHIEVYSGNPTYEFSTEPTFILIKLYSKKAMKDEGNSINMTLGNYGDSSLQTYNSQELDKLSYFAYASGENEIREKHKSHTTNLSRDKKTIHIFASLYDDSNRLLIDGFIQNRDSFIDNSLDATPNNAKIKNSFLHIGYDGKQGNFSYLLSYSKFNISSEFSDDVHPLASTQYMFPIASLDTNSNSFVISSELKYNYNTDSNKFITGIKYRYKGFEYSKLERNGFNLPRSGNTNQKLATLFVENQYSINLNSIITTGISLSTVKNNHSIQNDTLHMYRLSHTYTDNNWVFKTIYSHIELSLDPYLVNSYNIYITEGKKDVTEQNFFMENIIYEKKNNKYELILGLMKTKNQLMPDSISGLLDNYHDAIYLQNSIFKWTHHYNNFDKLDVTAEYDYISNIPIIETMNKYNINIRNLNTYNKFDVYNELLYYRDDNVKENYYDYNLGVKYHYSKDLSLSIKGENIFNKAKKTTFIRVNPNTFQMEEPLKISPIDQHFIINLEYLF